MTADSNRQGHLCRRCAHDPGVDKFCPVANKHAMNRLWRCKHHEPATAPPLPVQPVYGFPVCRRCIFNDYRPEVPSIARRIRCEADLLIHGSRRKCEKFWDIDLI